MQNVNKVISWVENLVEISLSFILILLVAAQVFCREVLDNPLTWSEEVCWICLVWLVFIGAAVACRESEHMNVTALIDKFSERTKAILKAVFEALILLFNVVVIFAGFGLAMDQMTTKFVTIAIPQGYQTLAVPVGSILIIYHILFHWGCQIRERATHGKEAVG